MQQNCQIDETVLKQQPLAILNKRGEKIRKKYPEPGEVFSLTLDGTNPDVEPLAMVDNDGYNFRDWKHHGPTIYGVETGWFKLVHSGRFRSFNQLLEKLTLQGKIPEGQWLEPFRAAYPDHDNNGPIGIADDSWQYQKVGPFFPYLDQSGFPLFFLTANIVTFAGEWHWRWLVKVG